MANRTAIRFAGHLGSSVLELAKASRLPLPYGYSSLWESRVNLSTQPTIIYLKTVRTTWPSRREMRTGSACASDSSLYPVLSIVTRLIIRTSAGFVLVTTLQVRPLFKKNTAMVCRMGCCYLKLSGWLISFSRGFTCRMRVFSSVCFIHIVPSIPQFRLRYTFFCF